MSSSPSGRGDPAKTLALLWRDRADPSGGTGTRKGPRKRLDVDTVVAAGIGLADAAGLEALTMRAIAERLSISPMSLYTYVPGKAELLDLMLDAVYMAMPRPPLPPTPQWRPGLRSIAEQNRSLYKEHPWAARITTARPPLGPGLMAKYEYELGALDGLGLSDLEIDASLTFLLAFTQATAIAAQDAQQIAGESGVDDLGWWEEVGPLLERLVPAQDYPLAARVGAAAGHEQGAAYDPDGAFSFGLERVLDGLGLLIESRA